MTADRWRHIESVYNAVLECDAHMRASYLSEACDGDADLRGEVESLLAINSSSTGSLDRAAWETAPEFAVSAPLALQEGTEIGNYRVETHLGSGGMGTVYRARDLRLNRPVAIKFLFNNSAHASAFRREAQLASSLNHPHILTVYDVGEFEGRPYLVTEFVDGGTLRDWAKQQERKWREAVEMLAGAAEGLAAAHESGILHRDIKPANILIATNGYAKLADFGLARLADGTKEFGMAGTIDYMAPEQASGQPVDTRSDTYSFGLVLSEAVGLKIPQQLRTVVDRALAKAPGDRYQSMRDLALDLRRLVQPAVPSTAWYKALAWTAVALASGLGLWFTIHRDKPSPNPLADATFTRFTDFDGTQINPAISPDGKLVAFLSDQSGKFDIWLRKIGGDRVIDVTQGRAGDLRAPLRSIGFSGNGSEIWNGGGKDRRLRLIPVTGGSFHNFLDDKAAEVAWSPDGKRVVFHRWTTGDALFTANGQGENIRSLAPPAPAGEHQHFATWSLDGKWIWFARGKPATREMDLWRISTSGGTPQRMTWRPSDTAYPTPIDADTVLYVARDDDGGGPWLWALNIASHESRRVSPGVEQYSSLAATANGRRLVASLVSSQVNLWSVPILGATADEHQVKPFRLPTARALTPRFGGGSLFYLSSRGGADSLWRYSNGQGAEIWKASDGALRSPPAVSPDGRQVALGVRRNGKVQLNTIAADGSSVHALAPDLDVRGTASWSPNGKWIVAAGADKVGPGLFKIPSDGGLPVRIAAGNALDPVWSPAGDLIVYVGTNTYTYAPLLGIRPDGIRVELPAISVRREGERARFLPDGKGLVYMQGASGQQDFWMLDLKSMQSRPLTRLSNPALMRTFDVTPDGKQIVFDRSREISDLVLIDLLPKH